VVGGASPAPLASGVQGSRQSGLHAGRLPPMSSGWSVPEIKLNNPTGGSLGPTPAGACLSLPQGPDPTRSGFPIRTAGRCRQGPGLPAADRARIGAAGGSGRPGRAGGPPAGGGAAAPSAGDTTESRDPKTGKTKRGELRGSGQVCRMAGEGARRAGNVPVRRIRCEWAPTPTEGPCEGICRGVAVEGPVGGVGVNGPLSGYGLFLP
jgi:hypothetical protein